jgi:hypothetical protein
MGPRAEHACVEAREMKCSFYYFYYKEQGKKFMYGTLGNRVLSSVPLLVVGIVMRFKFNSQPFFKVYGFNIFFFFPFFFFCFVHGRPSRSKHFIF